MDIGEVYAYPTCDGLSVNPHFASKADYPFLDIATLSAKRWIQDGWSAMAIIDRGRAFDFISWYRPLLPDTPWKVRHPALARQCTSNEWKCGDSVDSRLTIANCDRELPDLRPGMYAAVHDVSLSTSV
jgi:hypothetical protein